MRDLTAVSLRRMIILSVAFHGLLFLVLVFSAFIWPTRHVFPLIHEVELVSLPLVQQPKTVPEEPPKPVEKKPKAARVESLKIKKEAKVTKPVPQKKAVMPETAVVESPPVLKEPQPVPPEQLKEQVSSLPSVPEVMPILQRPYTEYQFYHALIGREIRKRWAPPPVSLQGQRMEAIVAFSISRSGKINSDVSLEKSSGNLFYDQAALRATMGPLPPPPSGYPEELLKMRLIYVLDQSQLN